MEIQDQLVARRFVLVDEEDNPVAYITGAERGFVGLHVQGSEAREPLVQIGLEAETGEPTIHLAGPGGGEVLIDVTEDGQARVYLVGADGTEEGMAT